MAILNYTTKIDYHKTLSEISKCLSENGAKSIMIDYQEGSTLYEEIQGKQLGLLLKK